MLKTPSIFDGEHKSLLHPKFKHVNSAMNAITILLIYICGQCSKSWCKQFSIKMFHTIEI
jgi:hypothetical protein